MVYIDIMIFRVINCIDVCEYKHSSLIWVYCDRGDSGSRYDVMGSINSMFATSVEHPLYLNYSLLKANK